MWNGKRMDSESSGMSIKKFGRIQKDWGKCEVEEVDERRFEWRVELGVE